MALLSLRIRVKPVSLYPTKQVGRRRVNVSLLRLQRGQVSAEKMLMFLRIFLTWVFLASTAGWTAPSAPNLDQLFAIDRIHTFAAELGDEFLQKDQLKLGRAIHEITPQDIARHLQKNAGPVDSAHWAGILARILWEKDQNVSVVTLEHTTTNRPFYRNSLREAFLVKSSKQKSPPSPVSSAPESSAAALKGVPSKSSVALDVDRYTSPRLTRAVFWDASLNQVPIEFHLGSQSDFLDAVHARGGTVVGQVETLARNYNRIFQIKLPGESGYRWAVTEVGGADRLKHLTWTAHMIRWGETGSRPPPMEVFGDPKKTLAQMEKHLVRQLQALPKADHVVIGQKGSLEKSFRAAAKQEAVLRLAAAHPNITRTALSDSEWKLVELAKRPSAEPMLDAMNKAASWDKIEEKLRPLFVKHGVAGPAKFEIFTVDNGTHEYSDYLLRDVNGQPRRWRVFSNPWGDEVIPVARALKATGHKNVTFIGTAGAMPGSGLQVGDLVVPSEVKSAGRVHSLAPLPDAAELPDDFVESARTGQRLAHVGTPLEETKAWAKREGKKAQLVEIETGYIAREFSDSSHQVRSYLLVSDVVGESGQTLAHANANQRRKALRMALEATLRDGSAWGPGESPPFSHVYGLVDELAPEREPVARFQIHQMAREKGATTPAAVRKIIESEPSFTTERAERVLLRAGDGLASLLSRADESGLLPRVWVKSGVLEGKWNPNKEPVPILISVNRAASVRELEEAWQEIAKAHPDIRKAIRLEIARGPPADGYAQLSQAFPPDRRLLLDRWTESLLARGGLASSESRNGTLRLAQIAAPHEAEFSTLRYFAPDEATRTLLTELGESNGARKVLEKEIRAMNELADNYTIEYSVKKSLPDGALARLVPKFKGDSLVVMLEITEDGLKSPGVVLEELIHLQQITDITTPWARAGNKELRVFVHPFHWAETVANAERGSPLAQLKIARAEAEASLAASSTVSHYLKQGLFIEGTTAPQVRRYLETRLDHAEEKLAVIQPAVKKAMKRQEDLFAEIRKRWDKLERSPEKLNDLVAKGDRAGVRKLIEEYLPWEMMEPAESAAWKDWLDAIEKPDPRKSKLVFRGMYDDTVLRNNDGKPFLMSTVLTRNQGSYTRRLRSLSTMREKFASQALRDNESPYHLPGRNPSSVSVMMNNHAVEAKGSAFISVADYDVATHFGPRQLGAFMLDERRMIPNALPPSKYAWQQERLVPLIIFPDEVLHFHDYARHPVEGVGPKDPVRRKAHFLAEVEERLGRKLTAEEISGLKSDDTFLQAAFRRLKPLLDPNSAISAGHPRGRAPADCRDLYAGFGK